MEREAERAREREMAKAGLQAPVGLAGAWEDLHLLATASGRGRALASNRDAVLARPAQTPRPALCGAHS